MLLDSADPGALERIHLAPDYAEATSGLGRIVALYTRFADIFGASFSEAIM
jgi:hypothetical protein